MLNYVGNASALVNKATDVFSMEAVGKIVTTLRNLGTTSICAAYVRKATGANVTCLTDTKYTGENVSDGDAIANVPIAPGSLRLTSSSIPTLIDRDGDGILRIDRTVGATLASGTDGITSAAATRQLSSASASFIAAGVVAGDIITVTSALAGTGGANQDAGEYTVVTVAANIITVDQDWPVGGHSNCSYKVISVDVDCGTIDYFTGRVVTSYPSSPSSASPTYRGSVIGTIAPPFTFVNGETITVDIDGAGAPTTATFTAVQAQFEGDAGTFEAEAASSLVFKIDGGTSQTLSFNAEANASQYMDAINTQLMGGYAAVSEFALSGMQAYLTELQTQYNAHMADVTYHDNADTNTSAAGAPSTLALAVALAIDLKTQFNLHMAEVSEVDETITLANELALDYEAHRIDVTSHTIADVAAGSVLNPALSPCTDYASALLLVNDIANKYANHLASAGVHPHDDVTNVITATAPATNQAELTLLANDIKAMYNAHLIMVSTLEECITLINDSYDEYLLHIVDTGATGSHLIADADPNSIPNPALYPAIDEASAILLSDDLQAAYMNHRASVGVHTNNDAGNAIVAVSPPVGVAQIVLLANDIKAKFNAHLITGDSEVDEAITLLNEARGDYELHRVSTDYHDGADAVNTCTVGAVPDATDYASACTLAGALAVAYEAHLSQLGVHNIDDTTNNLIGTATPATTAALVIIANDIKAKFNAHLIDASVLEEACALTDDLRTQYEIHRTLTPGIHAGGADAANVIAGGLPAATDIATCKAILDAMYTAYEAHRQVTPAVHTAADGVNVADAGLFPCAATVAGVRDGANELKRVYNAHVILVLGAVHAGTDVAHVTAIVDAGTAGIHLTDDVTDTVAAANVGTAAIHCQDDVTNTVTSVDAGTNDTHIEDDITNTSTSPDVGAAAIHYQDDATNTITSPNPGVADLTALQTLVGELYTKYPLHLANVVSHIAADAVDVTTIVPHILSVYSQTRGSSSIVQLVSGTAGLLTKLGFTPGTSTGVVGSNVADIDAVTIAEITTVVELAVGAGNVEVTTDNTYLRMTSNTASEGNASQIQIGGTGRTKVGMDNIVHYGDDADADQYISAAYINTPEIAAGYTVQQTIFNKSNDQVKMRIAAQSKGSYATVQAEHIRLS